MYSYQNICFYEAFLIKIFTLSLFSMILNFSYYFYLQKLIFFMICFDKVLFLDLLILLI